jgi:hypothetical protein
MDCLRGAPFDHLDRLVGGLLSEDPARARAGYHVVFMVRPASPFSEKKCDFRAT